MPAVAPPFALPLLPPLAFPPLAAGFFVVEPCAGLDSCAAAVAPSTFFLGG